VHPKVAQIVLRRDKGDKEDKGGSTEKEKYICQNGMLPNTKHRLIKNQKFPAGFANVTTF
jgi:hypothetical protein